MTKYLLIICFLFNLSAVVNIESQIAQTADDDTIKIIKSIELINIPEQSTEAIDQLEKIEKSGLSKEQLAEVINTNLTKLEIVDSIYQSEKEINVHHANRRHLTNNISRWKQQLQVLQEMENEVSKSLSRLEKNHSKIKTLSDQWLLTQKKMKTETPDKVVTATIRRVLLKSDSLDNKLVDQRGKLLEVNAQILDEITLIKAHISKQQELVQNLNQDVFTKSQLNLKTIISQVSIASLTSMLYTNIKTEGGLLLQYINTNQSQAAVFIILMIIGVFLFRSLNKRLKDVKVESDSYFKRQFKQLISAYSSTSFILIIWLSAFIFPNQPIIFKDIIRIILCIPLSILLYRLTTRPLFFAILALFFLLLAQAGANLFPPDYVGFQLFLLFAAFVEMCIVWFLYSYFRKNPIKNTHFASLTKNGVLLIAITITVAFVIGLFGYISFLEFVNSLILINTFIIALLYVSYLIICGVIEIVFDSRKIKRLKTLEVYGISLKRKLLWVTNLVLVLCIAYTFLASINVDEQVLSALSTIVMYDITLGSISFSINHIFWMVLILSLSIFISNIIKVLLEEDILSKTRLDKGLPHTVALLVKYGLITVGFTFALSVAGIPMQSFAVLIGAFGVGIGFGLQNIFNNLVSGLILLFERPIKINDVVEVGELRGRVKSIGIRSSVVRTFDGAEVIVPNGQFISNEVINWTHSDQTRRYEVLVGVAYGTDIVKTKTILEEQVMSHEDILKYPDPIILFESMGESSLDFRILYWITKTGEGLRIRSEVTQMVYDALNKEGINIPFPQRDIHIIKDNK